MIDVVNILTVPEGKRDEAVESLKKLAALHKKLLPEMSCRVLTPTTGAMDRVFLVLTFESHEQREQQIKRLHASPEWDGLIKEARKITGDRKVSIYKVEESK